MSSVCITNGLTRAVVPAEATASAESRVPYVLNHMSNMSFEAPAAFLSPPCLPN